MKSKTMKLFALMLTMVLCVAMSVSAFAADEKEVVPLDPDELVEYYEVMEKMPPVVIGTPETAQYDDSPNIQTRASGFLFSMRADGVHDLLVTSESKTFTDYDLDNGYLHITGNLDHSLYDDATIKIGGCWYDAAKGVYEADLYDFVTPGSVSSTIDTQFAIAKEYSHRGFIKNEDGVGYVTGNLSFWSQE